MKKFLILLSIFFLSSCTLTEKYIVEGIYESFNDVDHYSISKAKLEITLIGEDVFKTSNQLNVITDYYSSKHYSFNLYFYIIESSSYILVNVKDLIYQKGTPQTYIGHLNYESTYFTVDSSLTFIYSDIAEIIWEEKINSQSITNRFRLNLITNEKGEN